MTARFFGDERIEDRGTAAIEEMQRASGEKKYRKKARRRPPRGSLGVIAAQKLSEHQDWTDAQVAAAIGCNRTSLYRLSLYRKCKESLRQEAKQRRPRGAVDKDGQLVDAWTAEDDERLR